MNLDTIICLPIYVQLLEKRSKLKETFYDGYIVNRYSTLLIALQNPNLGAVQLDIWREAEPVGKDSHLVE
jgi:hypothetical protein